MITLISRHGVLILSQKWTYQKILKNFEKCLERKKTQQIIYIYKLVNKGSVIAFIETSLTYMNHVVVRIF